MHGPSAPSDDAAVGAWNALPRQGDKDAEIARLRKVVDAARDFTICSERPWFVAMRAALAELDGGNHE